MIDKLGLVKLVSLFLCMLRSSSVIELQFTLLYLVILGMEFDHPHFCFASLLTGRLCNKMAKGGLQAWSGKKPLAPSSPPNRL